MLMLAAAARTAAQPSLHWSPSALVRHDVQLLVDDAGMSLTVTQWPLPANAVRNALDSLPAELPAPLELARARVRAALDAAAGGQLKAAARTGEYTPSGYGDEASAGSSVAVRSSQWRTGAFAGQIGARLDVSQDGDPEHTRLRLDESGLGTELLGVQLEAFARRSWWGPGWQSSLALGDNAPPMVGVSLQRAGSGVSDSRWLSWMGPWTGEIFVARLSSFDGNQGVTPHLAGTRITFKPTKRLELGLTRMLQWGGEGRPDDFHSFFKALIGQNSNVEGFAGQDIANQLAGIDLRYRCAESSRCAFYTQLIGEDRYAILPKKLLALYGVEAWTADGRHRFFAEYADTECGRGALRHEVPGCAYRNYAYPGGYTQAGRWLGASAGPDSQLLTVGWLDAEREQSLRVFAGIIGSRVDRWAAEGDQAGKGKLLGVSARRTFHAGRVLVTPEAAIGRLQTPMSGARTRAALGVTVQLPM